jgi:undecaprenyl-diphosphatase
MTIFQAVILGVIEGITEFLPISSTAHLLITQKILGIGIQQSNASFDIIIQLGAILAACFFFQEIIVNNRKKIMIACIGFIPTGIIGLALHSIIKTFFFESMVLIGSTLLLGGIVILICEYMIKKDGAVKEISMIHALIIGTMQALALIPGVSRSAATIMTGLLLGITRKEVVEFSFLLAIPTMIAATGLDIIKNMHTFSQHDLSIIFIGCITSFITAYCVIRWLLQFIIHHTFIPFALYRIVVGSIILTITLT